MAGLTPRSITPIPAAPSSDKVGALVGEFLAEQKRQTLELQAIEARRGKKRRPALALTLAALCAIVWVAPSMLGNATVTQSPERLEAGARMTLFLASERIRGHQRAHGRLPATLAEAGVDSTGLSYRARSAEVFELGTEVNGTRITYHSTMHTAAFLGSTLEILGRP